MLRMSTDDHGISPLKKGNLSHCRILQLQAEPKSITDEGKSLEED